MAPGNTEWASGSVAEFADESLLASRARCSLSGQEEVPDLESFSEITGGACLDLHHLTGENQGISPPWSVKGPPNTVAPLMLETHGCSVHGACPRGTCSGAPGPSGSGQALKDSPCSE